MQVLDVGMPLVVPLSQDLAHLEMFVLSWPCPLGLRTGIGRDKVVVLKCRGAVCDSQWHVMPVGDGSVSGLALSVATK